jgi:hypothetical protein
MMSTHHRPIAYHVLTPTPDFPRDFWVLACAEGLVILEDEQGTRILTRCTLRNALDQGTVEVQVWSLTHERQLTSAAVE